MGACMSSEDGAGAGSIESKTNRELEKMIKEVSVSDRASAAVEMFVIMVMEWRYAAVAFRCG